MYLQQIQDKPLPFIETDMVTFLCASACPSNHSDVLSRVSASLQNALKDVISIHSFDSGQDIPILQGVKVREVVIF